MVTTYVQRRLKLSGKYNAGDIAVNNTIPPCTTGLYSRLYMFVLRHMLNMFVKDEIGAVNIAEKIVYI